MKDLQNSEKDFNNLTSSLDYVKKGCYFDLKKDCYFDVKKDCCFGFYPFAFYCKNDIYQVKERKIMYKLHQINLLNQNNSNRNRLVNNYLKNDIKKPGLGSKLNSIFRKQKIKQTVSGTIILIKGYYIQSD